MKSNGKKKGRLLNTHDAFGHNKLLKKLLISAIGVITYPGLNWVNKTRITGTENLRDLPENGVLFVSNHHTYFADVIALLHVFCSVKWKFKNSINNPLYLLNPRTKTYFVAADETMKDGLLPRIFAYAGSISIKRTWRESGKDINRQVQMKDISNIGTALQNGWVITFPQGTTTAFAPGRRGTIHIIKKYKPIVIPVTLQGFRTAFDKKGLRFKTKGIRLGINIKPPLELDYSQDADKMLELIMDAIEQSDKYNPVKGNLT